MVPAGSPLLYDPLGAQVGPPGRARPRRSALRARLVLGAAGIAGTSLAIVQPVGATSPSPTPTPPPPPSAIQGQAVTSIAVSPAFDRTGFVAAIAAPLSGCTANCVHLWVSFDGGNSWQQSPATGWNGAPPRIVLDGKGNEVMIVAASQGVLESTDEGDTWTAVGASSGAVGAPTVRPSFAKDSSIALAGQKDTLLTGGHATSITGSGGQYRDMSFAFMPAWPNGGSSAALLVGYDQQRNLPVIQHCTADLSCSGNGILPNAGTYAFPVNLWPSTAFASDGVVYAQTGNFVFKSIDGGNSFAPLSIGQAGAANTATPAMALAPGYTEHGASHTAYAAVLQIFTGTATNPKPQSTGGVYQSTDAGATWHVVSPGSMLDYGALTMALAPTGRLFASPVQHGNGLLCNEGSAWKASCSVVGNNPRRFRKPLVNAASGPNTGCSGTACAAGAPTASANVPGASNAGANGGNGTQGGTNAANTGVIKSAPSGTSAKTLGIVGLAVAVVLGFAAFTRAAVGRRRRTAIGPRGATPPGRE